MTSVRTPPFGMNAHGIDGHAVESFPRLFGGIASPIRGQHDPQHDNLQRLTIWSGGRLNSIADASQYTIGNVEVGESIDEYLLRRKEFDQRCVTHCFCPTQKVRAHQDTSSRCVHQNFRRQEIYLVCSDTSQFDSNSTQKFSRNGESGLLHHVGEPRNGNGYVRDGDSLRATGSISAPTEQGASKNTLNDVDIGYAVKKDFGNIIGHDRSYEKNAARHEGLSHLTALVQASGASRYLIQRKPRRNHLNPKYVRAINTIAAPAIHAIHSIRNSYAISLRSKNLDSQFLRFAVAPAFAAISVARGSRANAGHRGCV